MKRLQISLEPELDLALRREADLRGVSKAEVARRAIRHEVNELPTIEDDPLFKMFGTGGGGGLKDGETVNSVLYGFPKRTRD